MRYHLPHCIAALLTFTVGVVSANVWYIRRQPSTEPDKIVLQQPIRATQQSVESSAKDCTPAFERRYSNYDYAFSVQIPKGIIGFGSCHTSHGFTINLLNPTSPLVSDDTRENAFTQSGLYVDGSYNASEWQSFDDAIKTYVETLEDHAAHDIVVESKTPTRLSKLEAMRFVIRFNKLDQAMMMDEVVAFRGEDDRGIVYTIGMTTLAERYDKDKETLNQIQKSWRLQTLP